MRLLMSVDSDLMVVKVFWRYDGGDDNGGNIDDGDDTGSVILVVVMAMLIIALLIMLVVMKWLWWFWSSLINILTYHIEIIMEGMRPFFKGSPYVKGQINPRAITVAIANMNRWVITKPGREEIFHSGFIVPNLQFFIGKLV